MKLENKIVLVTGGGSGIGRSLAAELVRRGNRVAICGRDSKKLDGVAAEFPGLITVPCDVSSPQDRARLVAAVRSTFGGLDVLVNNAGVLHLMDCLASDSWEHVETDIAINLTAPIRLVEAFLPMLRASEDAAILNVTSPLGVVPRGSLPIYCATKAGLRAFTKSLRAQVEDVGIRVFEIIPPLVDTAMTADRNAPKMSPEAVVHELMPELARDTYEIRIGHAKRLLTLHRIAPARTERSMRKL